MINMSKLFSKSISIFVLIHFLSANSAYSLQSVNTNTLRPMLQPYEDGLRAAIKIRSIEYKNKSLRLEVIERLQAFSTQFEVGEAFQIVIKKLRASAAIDDVGKELIGKLTHKNILVRLKAMETLGFIKYEPAIPRLVSEFVKISKNYNAVRNEKMSALGISNYNTATRDESEIVRGDLEKNALIYMGDLAIPALQSELNKRENSSVCQAIIDILGAIGNPETALYLCNLLNDEDPWIAISAADALSYINSPSSIVPLENAPRGMRYVLNEALDDSVRIVQNMEDKNERLRKALEEFGLEYNDETKFIIHVAKSTKGSNTYKLYNHLFKVLGFNIVWVPFECKEDELRRVFSWARNNRQIHSMMMRAPYKGPGVEYLDVKPEGIHEDGVTVVLKNRGQLVGTLNDGQVLKEWLEYELETYKGKKLVLLGVGTVGAAFAKSLVDTEIEEICITDLDTEKAEELKRDLLSQGVKKVSVVKADSDALYRKIETSDAVVNTTGKGRSGTEDQTPISHPEKIAKSNTIAVDVNYNPPITKFLGDAEGQWAKRIVNGLGYLCWINARHLKDYFPDLFEERDGEPIFTIAQVAQILYEFSISPSGLNAMEAAGGNKDELSGVNLHTGTKPMPNTIRTGL